MAVAARTPARRARGLRAARGSQVVITTLAAVVLGSLPGGPLLARAGRARPPARGTGACARASAGRAPTQLRARGGQQGWPAPHPPWQPEQPLTQPRPGYGEQVPSPHAVAAHQGLGHWGDSQPNAPREDGPPSQKQIAFAEELARQAGRAVPEDAFRSRQECARVIDQLKGMVPPSQKRLAFAEELARQAGRAMPEDAFRSRQECDRVIDQLKGMKPPSQNQLAFAEELARQAGRAVPEDARRSQQECSKFITELEAARMSRQYAVAPDSGMGRWDHARPSAPGGGQFGSEPWATSVMRSGDGPPSQKQLALAEELAWQAGRAVPEDARRSQQECARVIDQLKGMQPPSQKQLAFAEELARQAGRAVPEDARRSMPECSKFISELEAARMSLQYAVPPDSGMGRWDHARPSAPGGGRGGEQTPSQIEVEFAEWLARDNGFLQLPDEVRYSKRLYEDFMHELVRTARLSEAPAAGHSPLEPRAEGAPPAPRAQDPPAAEWAAGGLLAPEPAAAGPPEEWRAEGGGAASERGEDPPAAEWAAGGLLAPEPAAAGPPEEWRAEGGGAASERGEDGSWMSMDRAEELLQGADSELRQLHRAARSAEASDEAEFSEHGGGVGGETELIGGAADVGQPEDEAELTGVVADVGQPESEAELTSGAADVGQPEGEAAPVSPELGQDELAGGAAGAGPPAEGEAARGAPERGPEARGGGQRARGAASGGGVDGGLSDKKVVFTGTMEVKRVDAERAAEAAGAIVLPDVSAKMDLLVAGQKAGSKLTKAKELGKEVWDEATFKRAAGL